MMQVDAEGKKGQWMQVLYIYFPGLRLLISPGTLAAVSFTVQLW